MTVSVFRQFISVIVAICLLLVSVQSTFVQAAMVSTETLVAEEQAHYNRERLLEFVNQDKARTVLLSMGVDAADLEKRINHMTPEELSKFNGEVDKLPAGGDASIFGVIIFILLLLIVLDLLGATNVFPAIRPLG